MAYRKFTFLLVLRIAVMISLAAIAVILLIHFKQNFSATLCFILMAISIAELIHFISRSHRDMENMVHSIAANDFSLKLKSASASSTPVQHWSNVVIQKMKSIYIEKEKNAELLQVIIQNVPVGLLCYKNMNDCILVNPAAKKLLSVEIILEHNQLRSTDPVLGELLESMTSGQRERIKVKHLQQELELAVTRIDYVIGNEGFNLFTFENISTDLDRKETESWQHLMRVLNHEIVNSITPIVSLSESLNQAIIQDDKTISSIEFAQAIAAITKRSGSLLRFATGYRTFTGMTKPTPVSIHLNQLLHQNIQLISTAHSSTIEFIAPKKEVYVLCDEIHLGQVVVNLLKNALEATQHVSSPKIIVEIFSEENNNGFTVRDNGEGMSDDVLGKVFVPYFTTKETGQGIGLSLCRQFVLANKGKITIQSRQGKGTRVKVQF